MTFLTILLNKLKNPNEIVIISDEQKKPLIQCYFNTYENVRMKSGIYVLKSNLKSNSAIYDYYINNDEFKIVADDDVVLYFDLNQLEEVV